MDVALPSFNYWLGSWAAYCKTVKFPLAVLDIESFRPQFDGVQRRGGFRVVSLERLTKLLSKGSVLKTQNNSASGTSLLFGLVYFRYCATKWRQQLNLRLPGLVPYTNLIRLVNLMPGRNESVRSLSPSKK